MLKLFTRLAGAAVATLLIGNAANASVVYLVSNTSVVNCGSAPHGLWTGGQNFSGGSCGNYYSIGNGAIFTLNNDDADSANWTGSLNGLAVNPQGVSAQFNLTLTDFAEVGNYKTESGVAYNSATDTPDIDFFETIAGTIDFTVGTSSFTYTINPADPVPGGLNFQFGLGANAKNPNEFGGSVWLNMLDENGAPVGGHFDLNLTFAVQETSTEVPEPGALVILGLGLISLGVGRRRKAV
tara:strand:- start:82 stop:798 length:717 start_codon:yes stop_codon:yes gene_type:complete